MPAPGSPEYLNVSDADGHGTHTAGTAVGAGNNLFGSVGVAYGAGLHVCRASNVGYFSTAAILDCYARCRDAPGVRVVSASYGEPGGARGQRVGAVQAQLQLPSTHTRTHTCAAASTPGAGGYYGGSQLEEDGIASLGAAGILFVAASGNEAVNSDVYPSHPASYPLPNVISVASSDWADERSCFSNYGTGSVHLTAPGGWVESGGSARALADGARGRGRPGAAPWVRRRPRREPTPAPLPAPLPGSSIIAPFRNSDTSMAYLSGTSMATPIVAGALALLASAKPNATAQELK